jgi:hypothetical protein
MKRTFSKRTLSIGIFFLLFTISCKRTPNYLEEALLFAGENRPELEKVLQHYSVDPKDSLKYKAAVFLIENMPGHYSYRNEAYLDRYYDEIDIAVDTANTDDVNVSNIIEVSARYAGKETYDYVWDSHIITADYLINNIEQAFDVWENGDWATHVEFDDFCEYILPYKVAELQTLDDWRSYSKELLKGDLDQRPICDDYKNSAYWAVSSINTEIIRLQTQLLPIGGINALPILRINTLSQMSVGTCTDYSTLALALMRSHGIPVIEDATPQWSFRPSGHSWNVLINNKGKLIGFSAGSSNPNELHNPEEVMAKVFRRTYAVNRDILALRATEEYVPHAFKSHFKKDVTDEYMLTSDIKITIPDSLKHLSRYAYLAVFDNKNWVPIHYGKISKGKVVFEKMGRNSMYLPVLYTSDGIVPFDAPFYVSTKGKIVRYEKSDSQVQDMTVWRKYYIGAHCYTEAHKLKGGKFQVSNRADFRDSITLYQIPDYVIQSGELHIPEETGKYRYWRYLSADEKYNNMAEMYFYQKGNPKPVYGEIIGTSGSCYDEVWHEKHVVFDGDPLTYYDAAEHTGAWVGLDFGKPVEIAKISYTPRADGNDITPGDMHEVLYWDANRWISLGRREADDIKMLYENVPVGTIYWIRNHSRGRDERIFTYENDKQIWW